MKCGYIDICGGCSCNNSYEICLDEKVSSYKKLLNFTNPDIFQTTPYHFRNRAEFRVFHKDINISYAMHSKDKKIVPIQDCLIVDKYIYNLMPKLLNSIKQHDILKDKLFSIEFLNGNNLLVSLIYHKKLDANWIKLAKELEIKYNINIIGRSKKQKVILSKDYIEDEINILDKNIKYKFYESSFTQPNRYINQKMLSWVVNNIKKSDSLVELYCGSGNFTLPLSYMFKDVLATEISKLSIKAAKENIKTNNIKNIKFLRMSAEEFYEAKMKKREFRRVNEQNIDLDKFNDTILVDPPRAGLGELGRDIVKKYKQIVYISCNPITLKEDLDTLLKTHTIKKSAFFDQFGWSNHIESAVLLEIKH